MPGRRKGSFSWAGIQIERAFPNNTFFVNVSTSLTGVVPGLKPWTSYVVAVAGYNNAGLGNWQNLTVTTLDSSKYTWHVDRFLYVKMAGYQLTSFVRLGTRQRRGP